MISERTDGGLKLKWTRHALDRACDRGIDESPPKKLLDRLMPTAPEDEGVVLRHGCVEWVLARRDTTVRVITVYRSEEPYEIRKDISQSRLEKRWKAGKSRRTKRWDVEYSN